MTARVLGLIGLCFSLAGSVIALINSIWLLYQLEKRHKKEIKEND
jgi:hypothetical protein